MIRALQLVRHLHRYIPKGHYGSKRPKLDAVYDQRIREAGLILMPTVSIFVLHCVVLHCIALHCIALHYFTNIYPV